MIIRLGYEIGISCDQPTEMIALLDVHPSLYGQITADTGLRTAPGLPYRFYNDAFGNSCLRISLPAGDSTLYRDSLFYCDGQPDRWPWPGDADAWESPVWQLPDEALVYLLPSRYCETDLMMQTAWSLFGGLQPGWSRVRAIFDYVSTRIEFGYQYARATRTAYEAHNERLGVCRDFAHLAITLCRCMNIPARYANGYLGDIGVPFNPAPMDYNAWCEVWLGGRWLTLDARHNEPRIGRVVVARGRDATDIPLLHSFGTHRLTKFFVRTEEVPDNTLLPYPPYGM